tara:strand:- start:13317 stop:14486 length:1170 start_codon:yes stop_codon:yes gene_type:complete
MGVIHKLFKIFSNFRGMDERTSNIVEDPRYAQIAINTKFREDGGIEKRKGHHVLAQGVGKKGLSFHYRSDMDTGEITETLVAADKNLHCLKEYNLDFKYVTSVDTNAAYYTIKANQNTDSKKYEIIFEISEEFKDADSVIYTFSLGEGFEFDWTEDVYTREVKGPTFITLKNLSDWIQGTGDGAPPSGKFTLGTLPSDHEDIPAAFLNKIVREKITRDVTPEAGYTFSESGAVPSKLYYNKWQKIRNGGNNRVSHTFKETGLKQDYEVSEVYDFHNLNNNLYIASGHSPLKKYDGNRVYNAGMKKAPDTSLAGGDVDGLLFKTFTVTMGVQPKDSSYWTHEQPTDMSGLDDDRVHHFNHEPYSFSASATRQTGSRTVTEWWTERNPFWH